MRQIKLILFILCLQLAGFNFKINGQSLYPVGVYMSLAELQQKQPSQQYNLKIERRTHGDLVMNGGNDYKPVSVDKVVKRKILKKKVWAIADSSGLYLNCIHHKCQLWYAKVEEEKDSVLVFKAAIPNAEATAKAATAGVLGGAIGGAAAGSSMAKIRYLYQMTLGTGKVILLSKK